MDLASNMIPSILHGETRLDRATNNYTLIHIPTDNDNEQSFDCDEFCGSAGRIARTIVGLMALVIFILTLPFVTKYSFSPISHIDPPRFFLNSLQVSSLNISEGELSTTWNVNLTISNGINSTFVNFYKIKGIMVYKEDIALAVSDPVQSENLFAANGVFNMDKNENATLELSFNTTGWENNQPIVDDDVIQEIGKEMKLGVVSFGLKIEVEAEIELNLMNVPVAMKPYCSNLKVDLTTLKRGEVATLKDVGKARECLDTTNQWNLNN